jgi:stage II sporulation protein D
MLSLVLDGNARAGFGAAGKRFIVLYRTAARCQARSMLLFRHAVRPLARASIAALLLLGAAACAAPARPGVAPVLGGSIRVRHGGRVQAVPLDTYAAAVALTEIAPGAESDSTASALYEAQILVARTYGASRRGRHGADGFDVCDTTHCQRYEPARLETARWAKLARAIAARTHGVVLLHDGRLIEAVFHADCGGYTADAKDVWGTSRPYLTARDDGRGDPHRSWTSLLAVEAVRQALEGDRRTRVPGELRALDVASRDRSGRAARIRISGERGSLEVAGDVFRAVITHALGIQSLPSTRFSLSRQRDGWRASGSGFGHGVGMCQAGALSRARKGDSAREIVEFYYPGAIIGSAPVR